MGFFRRIHNHTNNKAALIDTYIVQNKRLLNGWVWTEPAATPPHCIVIPTSVTIGKLKEIIRGPKLLCITSVSMTENRSSSYGNGGTSGFGFRGGGDVVLFCPNHATIFPVLSEALPMLR